MNISLEKIYARVAGYQELISLYEKAHSSSDNIIVVDFTNASWFDANLCAPLGALLHRLKDEGRTIRLGSLDPKVKEIFSKNGFLSDFGMVVEMDTNRTTMQYSRFEPSDEKQFPEYIGKHFQGKGIPKMSRGLKEKFRESILELFSNAVLHSDTKHGIFVCGQFFPRSARMDFSIVDMGVGIRHNVFSKKHLDLTAEEAISWAMEGNNTTRTGTIPGGLGLKLLREFIMLNKGRIQIVSDSGYWETHKNAISVHSFKSPFPGTLVNIEINTSDKCSYQLASEQDADKLF